MRQMTEEELTQTVLDAYAKTADARVREILMSLLRHLHAFVREVRLTEAEWMKGIELITAAGRMSDAKRQEAILFSDLLGVSALVNMVSAGVPEGGTESTVLGPFFVAGAPERKWGESLALRDSGEPMIVHGKVVGLEGEPVSNARIDVWQTDANGMYDVQDPEQPEHNLRGFYRSNERGEFLIKTIRPTSYPIPTDGPAGELVRAAKRHPWRPAHLHAMINAQGYQPLTTHVFDAEDELLTQDVVFAVKPSLARKFKRNDSEQEARRHGVKAPFLELDHTFVLARA